MFEACIESWREGAPSYYRTVFNVMWGLPADLVTLAHQGTKAYSNTFKLVHRREAVRPNAIWQTDHTPLDILVARPDGEPAKTWLTTVIDDYRRAVSGYFRSFDDPSSGHRATGRGGQIKRFAQRYEADFTRTPKNICEMSTRMTSKMPGWLEIAGSVALAIRRRTDARSWKRPARLL